MKTYKMNTFNATVSIDFEKASYTGDPNILNILFNWENGKTYKTCECLDDDGDINTINAYLTDNPIPFFKFAKQHEELDEILEAYVEEFKDSSWTNSDDDEDEDFDIEYSDDEMTFEIDGTAYLVEFKEWLTINSKSARCYSVMRCCEAGGCLGWVETCSDLHAHEEDMVEKGEADHIGNRLYERYSKDFEYEAA